MKMRKLVAVMMAVLMLCCVIPFAATADEASVTIDLTSKDNRTSFSTSQQVWEQNGITITNDKGASTSNVADYANPARFYKSSTVTIEYPGMTKIEIDSVTYDDKDYAIAWTDSFSAEATAVVNDGNVTITFAEPVNSFTWEKLSAQARAYSITVYGGSSEPEVPAVPVSYEADFDTIVTPNANGDSSYNKTYTTASGWVTENSAIQSGGATAMNPQFPVIGADNTSKAVCINGKTSAPGKITSPVLAGGINKLTINYTKMFTDTKLSATVTITDIATGAVYTNVFEREEDKNTKYEIWTYEWVLETPISGDFTIQIVNNCPTAQNSNKDRLTILDVIWETTGGGSVTPPVEPEEPDVPVEPEVPSDPEADTELSIADAIALGASKEHNVYTEGKYFVTGVITEVYNTQYGNMKIKDAAGNILTVYGTYSADGATRYDSLDVKPVAGDTVTVYGIIGQYNGTPQVKNGWITSHIAAGTPDVPVEPDVPVTPDEPTTGVVTNPVAGVAYKLGLDQTTKGAIYYFTGVMSGFYGATDTSVDNAVDMFVEIVDGGYKLYFNDANGAKQYIKLEQSGTHYNFTFGATGSVFTLDTEKNAFCAPCGDQICYMGTYGTYVTVGTLTTAKLKDSDYIARLYAVGGETPDVPVEPDVPVTPDVPTGDTLTIEEAIALGQTKEHNTFTEEKYYVTGVITEIYNTQYGNMKITDANGNILTIYGTWSEDGTVRFDALAVQPAVGETITLYGIIGQYNGTSQLKNGWIIGNNGGETPDEPDTPVVPDEPDAPVVPDEPVAPSVDTAFKFGMAQGNLENKMFYLAGGMNGYYMATTEDINAAIDVYLEATEGGYYFYTIADGAKLYINMVVSGTHVNGAYEATASTVYTYDADAKTLVAEVDGAPYWFGTRNDNQYTTMGPCKTEYNGFYGKFYTVGGEPVEPDSPATGDNSPVYVTLAVVLVMLAGAAVVLTSKKRA